MSADSTMPARKRPLILIVEDHSAVRAALNDWLTSAFAECRVASAASGEEALTLAAANPPDVVVMDVSLPQMSGIEAARRLRTLIPAARVLMLSIYEAQQYRMESERAGASAYVAKRTMHLDLVPALRRLLAEASAN